MTGEERARALELMREAAEASTQAAVARRIGRSAAAVSQVLKGCYAGDTDAVLELAWAEYGGAEVQCPVMGRVGLSHCIENRAVSFRPTNHLRVRLWAACRGCGRNPGRESD